MLRWDEAPSVTVLKVAGVVILVAFWLAIILILWAVLGEQAATVIESGYC